uniref:Uncharacterized protein n=1 Tax=Anopheles dirus TaxID=7168 RepID=A0A182NWA9_9DIPT
LRCHAGSALYGQFEKSATVYTCCCRCQAKTKPSLHHNSRIFMNDSVRSTRCCPCAKSRSAPFLPSLFAKCFFLLSTLPSQ